MFSQIYFLIFLTFSGMSRSSSRDHPGHQITHEQKVFNPKYVEKSRIFIKCPFEISNSPFDAEFHSLFKKKIKNIIALILEGFVLDLIFQIFVIFCLFFHYKGPYQPIFSPYQPRDPRGLLQTPANSQETFTSVCAREQKGLSKTENMG